MERLARVASNLGAASASSGAVDVVEERIMIPMRDGVRLSCSLTRPAVGGQVPVLLLMHYAGSVLSVCLSVVGLLPPFTARLTD
eukprot:SAG31_NODE_4946_length_2843_cov_1.656341_3_plen_84_part_00